MGEHYEMIRATTCLPVGSYTFTLYDAGEDGICCDYGRGEYGINHSKGRVVRRVSLDARGDAVNKAGPRLLCGDVGVGRDGDAEVRDREGALQ